MAQKTYGSADSSSERRRAVDDGLSYHRSWHCRGQRCGHALCGALSEPVCGPLDMPDLQGWLRRRCGRAIRAPLWHSRWLHWRRSLRPHRGSADGSDRTLDLDCASCSFERCGPRQYCRCARHDESRQLLLLLPPHDIAVSCSALGGVGAEVTMDRGPTCEGNPWLLLTPPVKSVARSKAVPGKMPTTCSMSLRAAYVPAAER